MATLRHQLATNVLTVTKFRDLLKTVAVNRPSDDLEIIKRNEALAPYTYLKLGGPAEMLAQPRSHAELSAVVQRCYQEKIPLRVLGSKAVGYRLDGS